MTRMMQFASNSSSVPMVNEEVILEQVFSTRRGHKTGVGHTVAKGTPWHFIVLVMLVGNFSTCRPARRRISAPIVRPKPLDVRESSDDAVIVGLATPEHTVPDNYSSRAVCFSRSSNSSSSSASA